MWVHGMWWMGFVWLMVLGLLAWILVSTTGPRNEGRRTPTDILDERFARGEIDADAYRSARSILERN